MRVALTGAGGVVGQALQQGLPASFRVTPICRSLDGCDLREADEALRRLEGHDAVLHLAWQYAGLADAAAGAAPRSAMVEYDNLTMARHVLLAAQQHGVSTVLLASSVHADFFYDWDGPPQRCTLQPPRGNDAYGSAKVLLEALGRQIAGPGFRVVCLRLGAVTPTDAPHPSNPWERRVWLSHRDLTSLIRACLTAGENGPAFSIVNAVSDNEQRVHDLRNPFGWSPQDGARALAADLSSP